MSHASQMAAAAAAAAACALAGAALFRFRGGAFIALGSSHAARAVYACGFAALAVVVSALGSSPGAGASAWLLLLAPALWLGACPAHQWGETRSFMKLIRRVPRGLLWTAPAAAVLYGLGHGPGVAGEPLWAATLIFGLAGALDPFVYHLAWRIPSRFPHLAQGGELGEALFGTWLGAALWLALS